MQNINVVIPMAGNGKRFYEKGYKDAKPFINVKGKMMIERVLENLYLPNAKYFLIAQEAHSYRYQTQLKKIGSNFNLEIIGINHLTDGAACTLLASHRFINNETPLIIANSDQIVNLNLDVLVRRCFDNNLQGLIVTFNNLDKKWSYARTDEKGYVVEVKEKVPISNHATVGIYMFTRGCDFIDGTMDMIANADKTNNEYYICPVYNYLIIRQKKIGIYQIQNEDMHSMGTPEDLQEYERYLDLVKIEKEYISA